MTGNLLDPSARKHYVILLHIIGRPWSRFHRHLPLRSYPSFSSRLLPLEAPCYRPMPFQSSCRALHRYLVVFPSMSLIILDLLTANHVFVTSWQLSSCTVCCRKSPLFLDGIELGLHILWYSHWHHQVCRLLGSPALIILTNIVAILSPVIYDKDKSCHIDCLFAPSTLILLADYLCYLCFNITLVYSWRSLGGN